MENLEQLAERLKNELINNDVDLVVKFKLVIDALFLQNQKKESYNSDKTYNKEYFANYYNVDKKTFNKWLSLFCPVIYQNNIREKRKFNEIEFNEINERFGYCNNLESKTLTKDDISLKIDPGENKKTRLRDLNEDLETKFDKSYHNLSKFPPKIAEEIIMTILLKKIKSSKNELINTDTPEYKLNLLDQQINEINKMTAFQRKKYTNNVKAKAVRVLKEMHKKSNKS